MGQTLTVLAREDGPYYARIREAVEIANNLQTYFRFVLEEATWLPREKSIPFNSRGSPQRRRLSLQLGRRGLEVNEIVDDVEIRI